MSLLSASIDLPTGDVAYKWNHSMCGLLCFSLSIRFPRFIPAVACVLASSLSVAKCCSVVWMCYVLICTFISYWICGLFPPLGYYDWYSCEHSSTCLSLISCSQLFGNMSSSGIARSNGYSTFFEELFEELLDCLLQQLHHFTFSPAMYEGSSFSTSSPTLLIFLFKKIIAT